MDWLEKSLSSDWHFYQISTFEKMKRKFEEIMDKVSENNNLMMEYAADFRSEIDENYVTRRGIHPISEISDSDSHSRFKQLVRCLVSLLEP